MNKSFFVKFYFVVLSLAITYEPIKGWQFTGEVTASAFKQTGFYEGVDFGNSFQTFNGEFGLRGKLPLAIRLQTNLFFMQVIAIYNPIGGPFMV